MESINLTGMNTLVRAGKMMHWTTRPEGDAIWTENDWARAATLEARFTFLGICEEERKQMISCAVWKAKFPGLTYSPQIENRLGQILNTA
jgi:hypothetical protein